MQTAPHASEVMVGTASSARAPGPTMQYPQMAQWLARSGLHTWQVRQYLTQRPSSSRRIHCLRPAYQFLTVCCRTASSLSMQLVSSLLASWCVLSPARSRGHAHPRPPKISCCNSWRPFASQYMHTHALHTSTLAWLMQHV